MQLSSINVKQNLDFISMLFLSVKLRLFAYSWQIYAKRTAKVLLLCVTGKKRFGSCWFFCCSLADKGRFWHDFRADLVANAHKKGMNDSLSIP